MRSARSVLFAAYRSRTSSRRARDKRAAPSSGSRVTRTEDGLDCPYTPGARALIKLIQSHDVFIRGCRPEAAGGVFLSLAGAVTRNIALVGNNLRGAGRIAEFSDGAAPAALRLAGNIEAETPGQKRRE